MLQKSPKATLEAQIGGIETQITLQEEKIAKEGGGYARQREQLKTHQARLTQQISDLEKRIHRGLCRPIPVCVGSFAVRAIENPTDEGSGV